MNRKECEITFLWKTIYIYEILYIYIRCLMITKDDSDGPYERRLGQLAKLRTFPRRRCSYCHSRTNRCPPNTGDDCGE